MAYKLACALRTASEPSIWVTTVCEIRIPDRTHVACRCRGLGTFALFTVARSSFTDAEKDLRGIVKVMVGAGGALCLAAAALQLLSLVPGRRLRLHVLLKAVTAGTHSAAVFTLLECDTTQEDACPGALGWVCVVCWCAGCAALCAAPLLLQAELAGRRQRSPSVALLAGCHNGGEVESRGGVGTLDAHTSSQVSSVTSYWRAPDLESPVRIHRRQSMPDTRADIVRCVEHKDSLLSPRRYDANVGGPHLGDLHMSTSHVSKTHAVCDLIAHSHTSSQRPDYMAHVCIELGVLRTPPKPASPLLTCSVDFRQYTGQHSDTSKEGSSNCAHSNPDVSKINSPPIKSCLKKPKQDFISSISLLPMDKKKELNSTSDIEQVNKEWNKAYVAPDTDRMLNKISNDLDFLLNRTQDKNIVLNQIEEAPT